jgi:dihydrofolate synthase/folylpolyglutamate synthase
MQTPFPPASSDPDGPGNLMPDFAWLERFVNFETDPGSKREFHLASMRKLLADFGDPQEDLHLVHIAGSKGKGSTAAYLAGLMAADLGSPVGIYGSPHVADYRERIRSALPAGGDYRDGYFEDGAYDRALDAIKAYMDDPDHEATTFELLTLMAFLVFREAGLKYAVIEVGLGGRLDSTNVITPVLSIITPIELEHTKYLGDSIPLIAAEKAGIIKSGVPVVVGRLHGDAEAVIASVANDRGCVAVGIARFNDEFQRLCPPGFGPGADAEMPLPSALRLRGSNARDNALTAYAAWSVLRSGSAPLCPAADFGAMPDSRVAECLEGIHLPGRLELRDLDGLPILLDAAHTVQSVSALIRVIDAWAPAFSPDGLTTVFSCLADKDSTGMLSLLISRSRRLVITGTGNFKRTDIAALHQAASALAADGACEIFRIDDPDELFDWIRRASGTDGESGSGDGQWSGVLATGSFYLLGELYAAFDRRERPDGTSEEYP